MIGWIKGLQLGGKLIMAICLAILVLLLVTLGPAACRKVMSLGAQVEMNEKQSNAYRTSASGAINEIGAVGSNTAASLDAGRHNEEDIRNAQGANQPVDPDANARGLRALCSTQSHRNDPICRVPQPHSR